MEVYHSEIKMISVFTPPTRTLLTLPSCPSRIYLFIYREISRDTQSQQVMWKSLHLSIQIFLNNRTGGK